MILKYAVGCDISKDDFHACISTIDNQQEVKIKATRKFANTNSGFKTFLAWCTKYHEQQELPIHFCMEASGVYYEGLAHYLHGNGCRLSIILANQSNKYLASLGFKSKTDGIDAKGLSRMAAERNLRQWDPPVAFYAELRALTRHHQSLKEFQNQLGNKLHALQYAKTTMALVKKQLKQSLRQAEKQEIAIETAIETHIQSDKDTAKKVAQICVIKGVGLLTVAVIIAETYGFELFHSAKQLVSYAGYDVVENQSGKRTGKTKISKKGNSRIRRILHLPAFNLVRLEQRSFYNLYHRTYEKHGIKMKSYVAVQKKLLTTIYALWKKDEAYDNDYQLLLNNTQEKKQVFCSIVNDQKKVIPTSGITPGRHTMIDQNTPPISLAQNIKNM